MTDIRSKLYKRLKSLSQHSSQVFVPKSPQDLTQRLDYFLDELDKKNIKKTRTLNPVINDSLSKKYVTVLDDQSIKTPFNPPLAGPKDEAINSTSSLEELASLVVDCRRCELCKQRTKLVFGQGPTKASIMVIGEGPGQEEDLSGKAFVGKAGKLLRAMMLAISVVPESVYITNIVKCRPPKNRNPQLDEAATCGVILKKQIAMLKPSLILLSGKVALNFFFPETKTMKEVRQKVLNWNDHNMIAMFHPAYILRNRSKLDEVWEDLKFLKKTILNLNQ